MRGFPKIYQFMQKYEWAAVLVLNVANKPQERQEQCTVEASE